MFPQGTQHDTHSTTRPRAHGSSSELGRSCRRIVGLMIVVLVGAVAGATPALAAAPSQTQGGFPFASGTVASKSGSTLTLTNSNGQTKVIVNASTEYRETKTVDAAAVTVGSCVRVSGTGSASKGIDASNVSVTDGSKKCAQTGGFGLGGAPGDAGNRGGNGQGPSGAPPSGYGPPGGYGGGGANAGNGQGFPTNLGMINGKVKSVSGDTVRVRGSVLKVSRKRNARPKSTTKTVTVTLSSATQFTQTVSATADAAAVGACVNAAGNTDSVGTVTADTVTVTQPVDGECSAFGGFGPNQGSI